MSAQPIVRTFDAVVDDVNKSDRTVVARVNAASLDRFNSVIDPRGARLDNYRKNPVVLWEHGKDPRRYSDPIGRNLWIRHNGGNSPTEILAKTRFLDDDFSRQRFEWYRDGVLNAFSIRALPEEWGPPTRDEIRSRPELGNDRPNETRGAFDGPIVYRKWDLAEYSATTCPGNADCLVTERALRMLDLAERDLLWLPDDVRPVIEQKARTLVNVPASLDRTAADSAGLAGGGAAVKPNVKGEDDDEEPEGDEGTDPGLLPGPADLHDDDEEEPAPEERAAPEGEARRIRKHGGKFYLFSQDGTKRLGGPYDTREQAEHREAQVDYFNHQDQGRSAPEAGPPGGDEAPAPADGPVRPDGNGGWALRDFPGVAFPDEATAERALAQLLSPLSFEAIHRQEMRMKRDRNDALIDDVKAMLDLQFRGIV